jgi:hypothetical protein
MPKQEISEASVANIILGIFNTTSDLHMNALDLPNVAPLYFLVIAIVL